METVLGPFLAKLAYVHTYALVAQRYPTREEFLLFYPMPASTR